MQNTSRAADERRHEHTAVTTHLLQSRAGVPYQVERTVCAACRRVLEERPLRRAAA
jgi:NMD protein affecting ribosome stability and mRNA decay